MSQQQTNEEKKAECNYLNSVRTNLTFCCKYPVLVIWMWQYKICLSQCEEQGKPQERCCVLPCCFKVLGALVKRDEESEILKIDRTGLVYSFLLSVGNDTIWKPVLESSTKLCADQFDGANEGYDCGVIPLELFSVIECSYVENYIKCPSFNPHPSCHDTMSFIKKCLRGDD